MGGGDYNKEGDEVEQGVKMLKRHFRIDHNNSSQSLHVFFCAVAYVVCL